MRLARLLPAAAVALVAIIASAQEPPPDAARSEASLFFPRTVARAEERSFEGTAAWRMIDLGPTRALEAVISFPGTAADMILIIEENPYRDLPDDMLIHAWPLWPDNADGPAVPSAYVVGVETPDAAQIGLVGTARGDWTIGLLAAAAERNHARLAAARVMIVELGLPDGKAYVGLPLADEQQRLLAGVIPAAEPTFPLAGPVEQRILGANAPGGTGGVLWDTPHEAGGVAVRGRFYLYDRGVAFDLTLAVTPEGITATLAPGAGAEEQLGHLAALSVRTADGEFALPIAAAPATGETGATTIAFTGEAALDLLRAQDGRLTLGFRDAAGTMTPVVASLPQRWNPFDFLSAAP